MSRQRSSTAEANPLTHSSTDEWPGSDGLAWPILILLLAICVFAVISRRPDAFLNPQFFAEDGSIWFADAYNYGWWHALAITHTGYFQTLPRLTAAVALTVPLSAAPMVMNAVGLILQIAPILFLLSYRSSRWAPLRIRVLMAFVYLALPNTSELNVSITEAQWHLGFLACLIVLSLPPKTLAGALMDGTLISLCGLTGPFCIVLLPIALIMWWREPGRWRLAMALALGLTTLLQGLSLVSPALQTRAPMPLGASFNLLCRILVARIFFGSILGPNGVLRRSDFYIYAFAIAGVAVLVYCVARARIEWKLFIGFAILIFAASMISPQASYDQPQWVALASVWATRYWFFPMLAFVWTLIWCAAVNSLRAFRIVGVVALVILSAHIRANWRYPAYTDLHFPAEVKAKFDPAPSGTIVSLAILPGGGWDMKLKKK
jgi:hypothetical protein